MTQIELSDTQSIILSAAAQRAGHIAPPLPPNLRGGAATKVVGTMLAKGLIEEVDADLRKRELIWRKTGDGLGVTLIATKAGLDAIGITESPEQRPDESTEATSAAAHPARYRTGTKQDALIKMLSAPEGATIEEIATALEWAPHTARGAMSGALKKRLGLTITSHKADGRGRVYQIETQDVG
jgi:hypothetical protein